MNLKKNHYSRRALALLLTLVMCVGMIPTAFAAQQNSYHDPAEHWMQASGRTNELDANSVVTRETFKCGECGKATSFEVFRVPEYTRNGQPALSRNVKYSDGTMVDGVGKGDTMDGIPGKDATYTGYHYTKAACETCGGINTNMSKSEYGYLKNVYWLYDCAAAFTQELDETVSYEYTDDTYHTVTTKGGTYCAFCYGTNHTVSRKLERHSMVTEVLPQPANGRFATVEKCSLCDYARYDYTAAKAVIADYYGVVDGKPHTITVSDLSEAGVRTSIRYGNSADSCTMTSAPNYTEEGQYMVYYEITYTYKGKEMTENGVAKVWLRDESTKDDGSCACGCDDPNCGCQNKNCNGNCCTGKGCGENHKYILLDSTKAGCTTLGYDRYLCMECGKIEKRDYVDSLGHAWQSIVIRDATCETDGKLLKLCSRCGQMKQTATPKGEHSYEVYTVAATCTSPGYTVRECSVCGDRHIEDITSVLPHNYESHVIAATCEGGGKTIHRCDGCGSSFVTDYTDALGHSWDEGTLVTNATCTGEGVMEYRCTRCGYHRIEGNEAAGHVPGNDATCTQPQLCTKCGAVLKNALGHDYKSEVTAPTCTEMGYTTNTCTRCGDTNKTDYWQASGESIKTSIRTKTRLGQIVQEGRFRGGKAPYGYQLVKKGRIGKKNRELYDIEINPAEAVAIRRIFDLADRFGYGGRKTSTTLQSEGIINLRTGEPFHYSSIQNILVNVAYTGVLRSGESISDIFPDLQIIAPDQFKRVQKGRDQRSKEYLEKYAAAHEPEIIETEDGKEAFVSRPPRSYPRKNTGKGLLSGNVYCGHCGGRIFASTARRTHHPKIGEPERIVVYKCYNRTQHKDICDGPTTYRAEKVDAVVSRIIRSILQKAGTVSEYDIVCQQIGAAASDLRQQIRQSKLDLSKKRIELGKWEGLMLDSLDGKCVFSPEQVKRRMDSVQEAMTSLSANIESLEIRLEDNDRLTQELAEQHQLFLSWAEMFDTATQPERKLIASQIIKAVTLSREYGIQIEFNISEAQYLNGMEMG